MAPDHPPLRGGAKRIPEISLEFGTSANMLLRTSPKIHTCEEYLE